MEKMTTLGFELNIPVTIEQNRKASVAVECEGIRTSILRAFKDDLITALRSRINDCVSGLISNYKGIKCNDGITITYHTADYKDHYFTVPSYEAMKSAIGLLEKENYNAFLDNKLMVYQTIKALMAYKPLKDAPNRDAEEIHTLLLWSVCNNR